MCVSGGDDIGGIVEGSLDGHGYLLLDLLGGKSRIERDDDDTRVREIGIGLQLKVLESPHAGYRDNDGNANDDKPVSERKLEESVEHGWLMLSAHQQDGAIDDDAIADLHAV